MEETERDSYDKTVVALGSHLDAGSKVMAAQNFCHLVQEDREVVVLAMRKPSFY